MPLPAGPQVEAALYEVRGAEPHGVSSPETDASLLAVLDPTRLAGPDAQSWLVVLRTGDSESPPPARAPRYRVRMPHTRRVQLDLPDEPHAVAERLRACARWRLFPYRGSWLGGDRPLGGRVSDTGFRLALDPRDLRQLSQAVAVGTLTPDGRGGTRLVADVGLPAWATWAYRLSWITALAVTGFAAAQLSAAGLPPLQLAALVTLFLGVGLVAGTLGIGAHVAHADAQVDPLADALEAACRGGRTAAPEVGRQRSPPRQAE